MEINVEWIKIFGYGRLEVKGFFRIWKVLLWGSLYELLEYVMLCIYVVLEFVILYCFGIVLKYLIIRLFMFLIFINFINDNDLCNVRWIVLRWEELVCV